MMKRFETPEIEFMLFETEQIMTLSEPQPTLDPDELPIIPGN